MENINSNKICSSCSKEPLGRINVSRFISKLDGYLKKNQLDSAVETVLYWEKEAADLNDLKGLLSVLNEGLGLFRRVNDKEKGLGYAQKVIELLGYEDLAGSISRATICINLATTLKAFGRAEEGLVYYEKAEQAYKEKFRTETYEYAALLNNKSSTLIDFKRFDEAEKSLKTAIEILDKEGLHDGDIALSYLSLAHLTDDMDDTAIERVENYIDTAWEYINSKRQKRDSDWAFALSKCIPSFKYFKRETEAEVLEELVAEIYGG